MVERGVTIDFCCNYRGNRFERVELNLTEEDELFPVMVLDGRPCSVLFKDNWLTVGTRGYPVFGYEQGVGGMNWHRTWLALPDAKDLVRQLVQLEFTPNEWDPESEFAGLLPARYR